MFRLTLATLHLLALGIGLGAVWGRARNLSSSPLDAAALRRAFSNDSWWGLAAVLWISTGLIRLLKGTEKATAYYTSNQLFMLKMTFLVAILVLEVWPMVTLIRWRISLSRGMSASIIASPGTARRIAVISYFEALLVLGMVAAAVAMARGLGG